MKWVVAQIVCGLSLFICNCAHHTDIVSIQSANVTLHNKVVDLGTPLNNWQSQFGTQDTITLSRTNGHAHLAYQEANQSFQLDDSAFYVLIEVDEKRRPSQMFYALSSEACANLGLELPLQDQKAFIDRGGCKK